jgi:CheY-like chemotaxis protein
MSKVHRPVAAAATDVAAQPQADPRPPAVAGAAPLRLKPEAPAPKRKAASAPPPPAALPRRGLRVLVAEDHPVNSLLIARLLKRQGHQAVLVRDGRQAVERFTLEVFDAVLMDLVMPEMDGLAATRAIRALEAGSGRRTPVIAVTAEPLDQVEAACAAAGLDACMAKPLDPAAVVEALMSLVG